MPRHIADDPLHAAFWRRGINVIRRLVDHADASLFNAVCAPTDIGVLARALSDNMVLLGILDSSSTAKSSARVIPFSPRRYRARSPSSGTKNRPLETASRLPWKTFRSSGYPGRAKRGMR